jgi:indolepyruvate ferredoxin oxidoreductase alpha subunit
MTGSEALAYGALEAGVEFVSGYPGSPSTATVEALLKVQRRAPLEASHDRLRIEWAINEKSAFDAAFGASLAGVRSLVCLKSVGLNVALDSLMVSNLAGGVGGFVILAGDDPGGWGSQNEEDSRLLAAAAEVPLLEPTCPADIRPVMRQAFDLSEEFQVPVVVRITRALAVDSTVPDVAAAVPPARPAAHFRRQPDRFNVLPIHVVAFHRRLQATLSKVQSRFERWPANGEEGTGKKGIIAAGYAYRKLAEVLEATGAEGLQTGDGLPLRILRLSTLHPLPERRIVDFLRGVDGALVVEETAPYVETQVQALAQRAGLALPILGRSSGHLPGSGELFAPHIAQALSPLLPDWTPPAFEHAGRTMPSRRSLCDDCPYVPAFRALLAVMEQHGGRDAFVVTGETGCMVRAQLPPWELLDVKYGMGSSIGLAAGLARSGIPQKMVALSGDSALLHSGLGELIDAVQAGVGFLVVVLDNKITALSGGQPHPATAYDAQGHPRRAVDLSALVKAAGADIVRIVDPKDAQATEAAFAEGLTSNRLSVVIVEQACPSWDGAAAA